MSLFDTARKRIRTDKDKVSLSSLKKSEIKRIMDAYKRGKTVANEHYRSVVEPAIIKRQEIYDAEKALYDRKFPRLSKLSQWVSRDVKTTIDWLTPSFIEVFTGGDDPVDIQGVNIEDDDKAKKVQQLIKYQVQRKNNHFIFTLNFAKEGLISNHGIAKIYWRRDEDRTRMEVMVDESSIQPFLELDLQGKIEIVNIEPITPTGDLYKLAYDEIKIKFNGPVIENLPPSELIFTPEAKDVNSAKFVAHRKIVKGDYLKRKEQEGIYRNVDKALRESRGEISYTSLDIKRNQDLQQANNNLSDGDLASKDVELYEAYVKVDYNGDGRYEYLIVHAVGDVPLSIQKNAFEMPPFFIFSPEYDPYKIFGSNSFADVLEQLQDIKTALVRQIIVAVAKNNEPRMFVDDTDTDMDALMDGDEIIPTGKGDPRQKIFIPPHNPIDPLAMRMIEYAQNEIESQSGSTRYNQGLDSSSLNKTATGINAIMGAADKKIRLIARIFAETAWIPIVKFLIKLNQTFLDQEQIIRLTNENVVISKDELNIDYDLIVNVGQGAGTREASIQYLMILMQQLYPRLEQSGIVDENSWYNISKELLEKMGIRNTAAYLIDPSSPQAQQKKQMAAEQQQQAMAQAEAAKNKPKPTVNYKDLPPDAKAQFLQFYGIQTTPEAVLEKELIDKG